MSVTFLYENTVVNCIYYILLFLSITIENIIGSYSIYHSIYTVYIYLIVMQATECNIVC